MKLRYHYATAAEYAVDLQEATCRGNLKATLDRLYVKLSDITKHKNTVTDEHELEKITQEQVSLVNAINDVLTKMGDFRTCVAQF